MDCHRSSGDNKLRRKLAGYVYDDGGRSQYFTGKAGDCVVRAVAIATCKDYKEVYKAAAKVIGYTPSESICRCCNGKQKTTGGYSWRYV